MESLHLQLVLSTAACGLLGGVLRSRRRSRIVAAGRLVNERRTHCMINNIEFYRSALRHVRERLSLLYGDRADACLERFAMLPGRYGVGLEGKDRTAAAPDQHDSVLIAYGDVLRAPGEPPLRTLKKFADRHFARAFRTIHLLPFFPYSSDDGFSVIHYRLVNQALGGWDDIRRLSEHFQLMFDLVLNHVSRRSGWFQDYTAGVAPARDYFIEADPAADYRQVIRPRSLPLLTPVATRWGQKHLWTTFSADQIDLNYANPDVLFEFLDLLLFYISMGAGIIRLDAIAYLWKKNGTPCIHLPETHAVVKLFRDLINLTAPHAQLLTETNVPHAENISYFGAGDEAHLVYQFALPPLLLHALLAGDARHLSDWAGALEPPPSGCAFLNFTASHDGIGVRPLQGLLPPEEIERLADAVRRRGGHVSTRQAPDGRDEAYELNITYYDALSEPDGGGPGDAELQLARFICSQTVVLGLQGVPAVYFNSLLADRNNAEGVQSTGQARAINRRKFNLPEVDAALADHQTTPSRAFHAVLRLLRIRSRQPAFHPGGSQRVLHAGARVFALARAAPDGGAPILAASNFGRVPALLDSALLEEAGLHPVNCRDLISRRTGNGAGWKLEPLQSVWLTRREVDDQAAGG